MDDPRQIAILRNGDGWALKCAGRFLRHFTYRVDAEDAALAQLAQTAEQGFKTPVLVQGIDGRFTALPTPAGRTQPA